MIRLLGAAGSLLLLFGLLRQAWRAERGNAPGPLLIGPRSAEYATAPTQAIYSAKGTHDGRRKH